MARKTRPENASADARIARENRALLAARALVDRMRTLYRELEQMTGAPITLHRALVCVGNEPGLFASRLAEQLGMQRPAVSQVLKNLESRGWIERRRGETDQRSVRIHCTAAGRGLLQATAGRAVITLQRAVRNLPDQQLESLAAGIEQLLDELPVQTLTAGRSRSRRSKSRS